MARNQANRLVNLNFDSLTDTITNLTGTLILVVVLVVGITGRTGRGGAGRTADALVQQLVFLQQQARQVDQRTKTLQTQVTALESRAQAASGGAGQAPVGPALEKPGATPAEKPPAGGKPPRLPPGDDRQVNTREGRRYCRQEALRSVRSAAFRRSPVAEPPKGGTTNGAFAAAGRGGRAANCSPTPEQPADVEQVRAAVAAARQTIESQAGRLKALHERIEELRRQLASVQPKAPGNEAKRPPRPAPGVAKDGQDQKGRQDANGKKEPAKQFTYRPPIEQFTTKEPIRFVCQENRVSVLPPDKAIIDALSRANTAGGDAPKPFEFELPGYDFRFRGAAGKAQLQAARKADRLGETAEAIRQGGSKFQQAMRGSPQRSPKTHFVLFYVWPDSYEVYRQARSVVWETRVEGLQYSDGWEVMLPADPMQFVRQPGRSVHVVQPH